jgi:NAD(P)H-nitrite reductase large subunit
MNNPATEMIVCRCEEVTMQQLLDAVHDGATSVAGVKKRTRACMGPCQGRICQPIIQRIIAKELGRRIDEITLSGTRSPVRPVPLGLL